jgi:uncharacterized protein YcgL (UPF0745 family)
MFVPMKTPDHRPAGPMMETGASQLQCTIHRARSRAYTYLYLREDADPSELPPELVERFDLDSVVMTLELSAERPLAQEDVRQVMEHLEEPGYHIQWPPEDDPSGWLDLPSKTF